MSNSIEIDGFEDLEKLLLDMTISEQDAKKAMRKAIEVLNKGLDGEIPVGKTKRLSKRKKLVKKEGLATVGIVSMTAFYDFMQEFGTSQNKSNIGFFERGIEKNQNEAIKTIANELLK